MTEKMSRQQRRAVERERGKLKKRQNFSREEILQVSLDAYKQGRLFALLAAKEVLGLGPVRLERIEKRIAQMEEEKFSKAYVRNLKKK